MGIDMINPKQERVTTTGPVAAHELGKLSFSLHSVPNPAMSIWLMALPAGTPAFPWFTYGKDFDEDINKLSSLSGISSPQGLFDFLFLLQLKKAFPDGLYAIVPGNVRTEGWNGLSEPARQVFDRGQSCLYRLEAAMSKKLSVNWVPFYQPQCMVRDASGDNLVRFFNAAKSDDVANSISFIAVNDVRKMPAVVNLLVTQDDKRSEKMAQIADWFGVYSSPRDDKHGTCALAYSTNMASVKTFAQIEKSFSATVDAVRRALLQEPTPGTVIKLLSRLIAL